MFGGRELDATVLVILMLELAFVAWWQLKSGRRDTRRLVDDAVRLGARARRPRA
jgi:hypothetical protein